MHVDLKSSWIRLKPESKCSHLLNKHSVALIPSSFRLHSIRDLLKNLISPVDSPHLLETEMFVLRLTLCRERRAIRPSLLDVAGTIPENIETCLWVHVRISRILGCIEQGNHFQL